MKEIEFLLEPDEYTPDVLGSGILSSSEMRKEYARLRKIALKRLDKLSKSEFNDSMTYLRFKDSFQLPQTQLNERDLAYNLIEVHDFLMRKLSSVRGQQHYRKVTLKKLHEIGFTKITKENFNRFGQFMEAFRGSAEDKIYSSDELAELFEKNYSEGEERLQQIEKDFEYYVENDRADRLPHYTKSEKVGKKRPL